MTPEDWQLKHMLWEISDRMFVIEAEETTSQMSSDMKRVEEIEWAAREVERMRGTR